MTLKVEWRHHFSQYFWGWLSTLVKSVFFLYPFEKLVYWVLKTVRFITLVYINVCHFLIYYVITLWRQIYQYLCQIYQYLCWQCIFIQPSNTDITCNVTQAMANVVNWFRSFIQNWYNWVQKTLTTSLLLTQYNILALSTRYTRVTHQKGTYVTKKRCVTRVTRVTT